MMNAVSLSVSVALAPTEAGSLEPRAQITLTTCAPVYVRETPSSEAVRTEWHTSEERFTCAMDTIDEAIAQMQAAKEEAGRLMAMVLQPAG